MSKPIENNNVEHVRNSPQENDTMQQNEDGSDSDGVFRKSSITETNIKILHRAVTNKTKAPQYLIILNVKNDCNTSQEFLPAENNMVNSVVCYQPVISCGENNLQLLEVCVFDVKAREVIKHTVINNTDAPQTKHNTEYKTNDSLNVENMLYSNMDRNLMDKTETIGDKLGKNIKYVIDQIERFIKDFQEEFKINSDFNNANLGQAICFATLGPFIMRQWIHGELGKLVLNENSYLSFANQLPEYYNRYYDLNKLLALQLEDNTIDTNDLMSKIVLDLKVWLDRENEEWGEPEIINTNYESGISSDFVKKDLKENTVVRARGLPWQSSDQDIVNFFRGLNIHKAGIALCLSPQGRRNGEAYVMFENSEQRELALQRHKNHMGNRYIEVYRAGIDDFLKVVSGSSVEVKQFLSQGAEVIVRMRGLPYDANVDTIYNFYATNYLKQALPNSVEPKPMAILFVRRSDGRATGDAFVSFRTEEEGKTALSMHRNSIGNRYIEVFRSTTSEIQQVVNRSLGFSNQTYGFTKPGNNNLRLIQNGDSIDQPNHPLQNGNFNNVLSHEKLIPPFQVVTSLSNGGQIYNDQQSALRESRLSQNVNGDVSVNPLAHANNHVNLNNNPFPHELTQHVSSHIIPNNGGHPRAPSNSFLLSIPNVPHDLSFCPSDTHTNLSDHSNSLRPSTLPLGITGLLSDSHDGVHASAEIKRSDPPPFFFANGLPNGLMAVTHQSSPVYQNGNISLLPNGLNPPHGMTPSGPPPITPIFHLPMLNSPTSPIVIPGTYKLPLTSTATYVPQSITRGSKKDCIRLRGLPFEAKVEQILEFLGDFSKFIMYQGVHMIYNVQGNPSGEAFIQMNSEQSAKMTSLACHNKYMKFGRKQRYIEVFQCSGDEMNLILSGLPPAGKLNKMAATVAMASSNTISNFPDINQNMNGNNNLAGQNATAMNDLIFPSWCLDLLTPASSIPYFCPIALDYNWWNHLQNQKNSPNNMHLDSKLLKSFTNTHVKNYNKKQYVAQTKKPKIPNLLSTHVSSKSGGIKTSSNMHSEKNMNHSKFSSCVVNSISDEQKYRTDQVLSKPDIFIPPQYTEAIYGISNDSIMYLQITSPSFIFPYPTPPLSPESSIDGNGITENGEFSSPNLIYLANTTAAPQCGFPQGMDVSPYIPFTTLNDGTNSLLIPLTMNGENGHLEYDPKTNDNPSAHIMHSLSLDAQFTSGANNYVNAVAF